MSFILMNEAEQKIYDKFRTSLTETKINFAYYRHADKQTKYFLSMCERAKVNPTDEATKVAWFHLYQRHKRGL